MLLSTGSGAGLWTLCMVFEGERMGLSDELDGDDLTNELMDEGEQGIGALFVLSDFLFIMSWRGCREAYI